MSKLDPLVEVLLVERYSGTWWKARAAESFAAEALQRETGILADLDMTANELERRRGVRRYQELTEALNETEKAG